VAGNEPVTSPDQHKPTNVKLARLGGIVTIAILLLMTIGNHQGMVENLWLIGIALVLAVLMLADWLLRKNGLNTD
jgi:ABC-type enterobactin transport system permease subunit